VIFFLLRLPPYEVVKPISNRAMGSHSAVSDRRIWFMEHGFSKLSKGPGEFAAILQAMRTPVPHLSAGAQFGPPG
jgi:hypothetical protein